MELKLLAILCVTDTVLQLAASLSDPPPVELYLNTNNVYGWIEDLRLAASRYAATMVHVCQFHLLYLDKPYIILQKFTNSSKLIHMGLE